MIRGVRIPSDCLAPLQAGDRLKRRRLAGAIVGGYAKLMNSCSTWVCAWSVLLAAGECCRAAISVTEVAPGVFRGAAPRSDADYAQLKRLGIKTVLNLRKRDQSAIAVEGQRLAALGIHHRHVPMDYFPRRDGSVPAAMQVLSDVSLRPIYVHCKHGRDRTGLVVGLHRVRHQGWDHAAAYREMTQLGFDSRIVGLRRYFWRNAGERAAVAQTTAEAQRQATPSPRENTASERRAIQVVGQANSASTSNQPKSDGGSTAAAPRMSDRAARPARSRGRRR